MTISARGTVNTLLQNVEALSEQNLFGCYQCGTCSASCPFAAEMDLRPAQIIRHLVFGLDDVLASRAIWLCTACHACSERCPRGLDMARIMAALRQISLRSAGNQGAREQLPPAAGAPPIALIANARCNTG